MGPYHLGAGSPRGAECCGWDYGRGLQRWRQQQSGTQATRASGLGHVGNGTVSWVVEAGERDKDNI